MAVRPLSKNVANEGTENEAIGSSAVIHLMPTPPPPPILLPVFSIAVAVAISSPPSRPCVFASFSAHLPSLPLLRPLPSFASSLIDIVTYKGIRVVGTCPRLSEIDCSGRCVIDMHHCTDNAQKAKRDAEIFVLPVSFISCQVLPFGCGYLP